MALVLVVSLLAAGCYAVGIVLQYHEAHQAPDRLFLSPKLLGTLARHPLWLAGLAMMFAGQGLQAVALDDGNLAIVEPLMTLSLLFALPLAAAWRRERVQRRKHDEVVADHLRNVDRRSISYIRRADAKIEVRIAASRPQAVLVVELRGIHRLR